MLIMITGGTGYIGRQLIGELISRGHSVRVLTRSQSHTLPVCIEHVRWELGKKLSAGNLKNVDAMIHLAHDFSGVEGVEKSVSGTTALFNQGKDAGVTRQLFVSSYSSGIHAKSDYGMAKYNIEQYFLGQDACIVRPGLVLGDGGIFGRIKSVAQRWSIIPLPDGGRGRVPVIEAELLARLLCNVVEGKYAIREFNLFEPELVCLRDLVMRTAAEVGRSPAIIPIPAQLVLGGLKLLERIRVRLPVNSDNLRGFLSNQEAAHLSSLTSNLEIKNE